MHDIITIIGHCFTFADEPYSEEEEEEGMAELLPFKLYIYCMLLCTYTLSSDVEIRYRISNDVV